MSPKASYLAGVQTKLHRRVVSELPRTFQRNRVREWGLLALLLVVLIPKGGLFLLMLKALVFVLIAWPALRRAGLPAAEISEDKIVFHKSIFSCDVVFRRSSILSWRYYADNLELVVTAEGGFTQSWKTQEFTLASRAELLAWLSQQVPSGEVIEDSR